MTLSAMEDPIQRYAQLWIRAFYVTSNLILTLLGIGGLFVSVFSKMNYSSDLKLLDHYQNLNVNIFLAGSVLLMLIGWLGIFAGFKNCYKSMRLNAVLLSLFLVSTTAYTISMGVLTDYTQKGDLYQQMQDDMINYSKTKNIIDTLHNKLSCCGLNDVTIWRNEIPASCCRNIGTKCVVESSYLQTNGCFKEFTRTSRYYAWLIFSVLTSAGLIEIFIIILSFVQCHIIKDMQRKKRAVLKIPRPQVMSIHVENEMLDNEKNDKLEKKKKGEKIETDEKGEKKEKNDKEEQESKKEPVKINVETENLGEKDIFEEVKQGIEKIIQEQKDKEEEQSKEELAKESEEARISDKIDEVEEFKQNT